MNKDVPELLSRGVGTFIDPDGSFKDKLLKKSQGQYDKDIIIKLGVDPTRPDIHLGHAVVLRRLRQFQDFGCKVVFIVGDFTAKIGDPTGRSKVRPELEQAEIETNVLTYTEQMGKILRTEPDVFSWIKNSDWFTNITDLNLPEDYKINMDITTGGKTTKVPIPPNSFVGKAIAFEQSRMQIKNPELKDKVSVITLANFLWSLKHLTHSRLIERDMFQERIKNGQELYLHEMMYPILQGIDSYVISQIYGSCDLEIGGTDQTFNMLIGRDIMKANNAPEQAVMSMEILPGTDGKEKMSKSLDNYIAITDAPSEMYGKVMSLPDEVMPAYFKLATYTPLSEIEEMEKKLSGGKHNPKDMKMRLAHEITAIYHGEVAASNAEKDFTETFSNKGVPKDIPIAKVKASTPLVDTLLEHKIVASKTEFNRLNKSGSIKEIENGVYRIGKHRFLKIEIED
ncbi:MAG: tyrosine--tRNA ligase [Candidatus Zambryskibacteria bacterium]|nr:tyrosine--tRNA ligase [Candidatus Zambryskibacteria bacterium]